MYCILITGIPAAGKSTMAGILSKALDLPVISKDKIKELLFDTIGFRSREEKVKLGIASMDIMYHMAEQLMDKKLPFILENNFENASKEGLQVILEKHGYIAITITLTGDYKKIYERFLDRNNSPDRHVGHVVNDYYPQERPQNVHALSYEEFVEGITKRGMDTFAANGPHIRVDTTDFDQVNTEDLVRKIIDIIF